MPALTPGTRLGPYEVLDAIGAGGMGEVYRAKDTNLDRDVAIKVLPDSFALDADRVARFTREAKTLASLNHPNIAAIYGIESNALVMELRNRLPIGAGGMGVYCAWFNPRNSSSPWSTVASSAAETWP